MKLIIQDQVHYQLKTPVFKQYQTHLHPVEIISGEMKAFQKKFRINGSSNYSNKYL